jgi:1,4-dihydroxy-2-naphthoate octaprenyltransferase
LVTNHFVEGVNKLTVWILAARPKTLPAAIVPVALGGALAYHEGAFELLPWAICLVFALLIQVGTNFANDYYDFVQGADGEERIGPKRAVASGWVTPRQMKVMMFAVFAVAFVIGSTLILYGGSWLLIVGILSVICGIAYTGGPYPLGYNGLGDIFVFLFFGWVATWITYFVQVGTFEMASLHGGGLWPFLVGMVPGALATNLLVVNNVRDAPLDAEVGKRTLVVRFGRVFGLGEFAVLSAIAHLVPLLFAIQVGDWRGGLSLLALPVSFYSLSVLRGAQGRDAYERVLVLSAMTLVVVGLLFSIGLMLTRAAGSV